MNEWINEWMDGQTHLTKIVFVNWIELKIKYKYYMKT